MEIHQLKTFIAVAREGSITRASERLYLSQPAVSAHIKAIEETLRVTLFMRTARGMALTPDGERLLVKAEQTVGAHRDFLNEATRIRGNLTGLLKIGGGSNSCSEPVGRLILGLSDRYPDIEVQICHGHSLEVLEGIRNGSLDAGFYNEPADPPDDLVTLQVSHFRIWLAAPVGTVENTEDPDWQALADLPWIYPADGPSCCGHAAENLFRRHQFRPRRVISIDRESVTRTLIAGDVGIGLLHDDTAQEAQQSGEVDLVCEAHEMVSVMFAWSRLRETDPLIAAATQALSHSCSQNGAQLIS